MAALRPLTLGFVGLGAMGEKMALNLFARTLGGLPALPFPSPAASATGEKGEGVGGDIE